MDSEEAELDSVVISLFKTLTIAKKYEKYITIATISTKLYGVLHLLTTQQKKRQSTHLSLLG